MAENAITRRMASGFRELETGRSRKRPRICRKGGALLTRDLASSTYSSQSAWNWMSIRWQVPAKMMRLPAPSLDALKFQHQGFPILLDGDCCRILNQFFPYYLGLSQGIVNLHGHLGGSAAPERYVSIHVIFDCCLTALFDLSDR